MDSKNQNRAAVDNILQELKSKPASGSSAQSVDDILAEMGLGKNQPGVPTMPPRPTPKPPQPQQAAQAMAPAKPPAPTPQAEQARATPPPTAAPTPPPPAKAEPPAKPVQRAAATPSPTPKKSPKPDATIWDIEVGQTTSIPRVGKAAAFDKVDKEKFSREAELLSWFSGESEPTLSRREQKKADKEERKRQAAELKAEKRRIKEEKKLGIYIDEDEDDYSLFEAEQAAPYEVEEYAEEYTEEYTKEYAADHYEQQNTGFFAQPEEQEPQYEEPSAAPQPNLFNEAETLTDINVSSFAATAEPTNSFLGTAAAPPRPKPGTTMQFEAIDNLNTSTMSFDAVSEQQISAAFSDEPPPAVMSQQANAIFSAIEGNAAQPAATPFAPQDDEPSHDTRSFDLDEQGAACRVPTAAYTQEFESGDAPAGEAAKTLFVDEMVDDRFRDFFQEAMIVTPEEPKPIGRGKRKRKKSRSAILTGEFAKLAEQAEQAERAEHENLELDTGDFEDYNHPQDAEAIAEDIASLRTTLTRRTVATLVISAVLMWLSLGFANIITLPVILQFALNPIPFCAVYLALVLLAIIINFTTVATGLVGLVAEPTVDSPPALASLFALLQAVMLLAQTLSVLPIREPITLFGSVVALTLAFNAFGKRVRAVSILNNFRLASAGMDHSAAYIIDNSTELAFNITKGLNEPYPTLLLSRPTALVKGFLRQSFSQRATDRRARVVGWALLILALGTGAVGWIFSQDLLVALSAATATLCLATPLTSSLVSGIPSYLMQRGTERVGAVVPGWSAIEDLGNVNVVMANSRDIFPASSVYLKGIKTFEKERIDLAILYAASVLTSGCDTLRDIFIDVVQGKNDMLYKVESLTTEPGRGFTAWVQNNRVVIGNRDMLRRHDIEPPPIELEMKLVPKQHYPVYLAVSGKLFALFIVGYNSDANVAQTLESLVKSGVSLIVNSDDMNITSELIEQAYDLPQGVVKVLGPRELDIMQPLTEYLPESDGVMTHMGTFASFIGGMRAAASGANSERMSNIVQIASAVLGCGLALLLAFSGGLSGLSIMVALLYQLGWTALISVLPLAHKY